MHPYLLFRGQDIKDLHVHENAAAAPPPPAAQEPPVSSKTHSKASVEKTKPDTAKVKESESDGVAADAKPQEGDVSKTTSTRPKKQTSGGDRTNNKSQKQRMIGSGASLLHRKARGAVDGVEGKSWKHHATNGLFFVS